ncbi:MAG: hypothetical protein ACOC93_00305, partial [Planctomycetota bacterium]
PGKWLILGPFDRHQDADPLALLGRDPRALQPGQKVAIGDVAARVAPLADEFVKVQKGWQEDPFGRRHFAASNRLDVLGPIGRKSQSLTYYYTVLRAIKPRVVRVQVSGGKGSKAWVAGESVADGDRLRLKPGYYPVLLSVELKAVPPFGKAVAGFRLRDCDDPLDAYPSWLDTLKTTKPRLERIVDELPGSAEARQAVLLLKHDPNYVPPEPRKASAENAIAPAAGVAPPAAAPENPSAGAGGPATWPLLVALAAGLFVVLLVVRILRNRNEDVN